MLATRYSRLRHCHMISLLTPCLQGIPPGRGCRSVCHPLISVDPRRAPPARSVNRRVNNVLDSVRAAHAQVLLRCPLIAPASHFKCCLTILTASSSLHSQGQLTVSSLQHHFSMSTRSTIASTTMTVSMRSCPPIALSGALLCDTCALLMVAISSCRSRFHPSAGVTRYAPVMPCKEITRYAPAMPCRGNHSVYQEALGISLPCLVACVLCVV